MLKEIRTTLTLFFLLTLICGVIYPLVVTGVGQVFFPNQAKGSIIYIDGRKVGSELIGQPFSDPRYFWPRPSATNPIPYNAEASGGSNLGPTNPIQTEAIRERVAALKAADPGNSDPIPIDLLTASGSGLDPHISPAAAYYQVPRIARTRGIPENTVSELVNDYSEGRQFGIWGEPRVNVVKLNIALDHIENSR